MIFAKNGCRKWHFLVRGNRLRIWRTGWHTPSENSEEYSPSHFPPGIIVTQVFADFHGFYLVQNFCILAEFSQFRPIVIITQDAEILHPNKIVTAYVVRF